MNKLRFLLRTLPEKLSYALSVALTRIVNGQKNLKQIEVKKILCIKTDEIGDLCYSIHIFEMLKKQYPQSELTLICKPFAITLTNNNPFIDHITSNWKDITGKYDLIVDLRPNRKSLWHTLFHLPKMRLDRGTVRLYNKSKGKHPHEVITNKQIVEPIIDERFLNITPRLFVSDSDKKKVEQFLIDNGIKQFAVLHPFARKKLRQWDKFAALAQWLKTHKGLDIIFTGDHYEKNSVKTLQSQIGFETHSIAGIFNLTELAALCMKAEIYIGNESGPLHIASVCGTRSLGLYGPGEPHVFYPFGTRTDYLHYVLECNPCDQRVCIHPDNPCIKRIQLAEVIEKIERLISLK